MPDDISPEVKQQRMKEFMQLLPLTLDIAGLPKAEPLRLFNHDQMEARVTNIRIAYKLARALVREIGESGVLRGFSEHPAKRGQRSPSPWRTPGCGPS